MSLLWVDRFQVWGDTQNQGLSSLVTKPRNEDQSLQYVPMQMFCLYSRVVKLVVLVFQVEERSFDKNILM